MVIGIYPRKSVYRDNSDSVQVQVQMCKEYAGIVYKGHHLEFRVYDRDEGFSGKNMNRPSFQELMADVRSGVLNAVVVYKLDRISRNVREFSSMYEVFQQHNVSFISVKESFDTSTPMGRTVMYILAAFAQLERENTSERVTDSMRSLGAAGKWTGGRCPAGMTAIRQRVGQKEHSFLIVDQETIGTVKLLYELLLQGYTITGLERYCRDHGIRSQSGAFLSSSQIYNILSNPVYCQNSPEAYAYFSGLGCQLPDMGQWDGKHGLIGYGKTKNGAASQKRQGKQDWAISIGIHDPVVSASDWIAAQKRFGLNKMFRSARYEIGILKGVLHCSCGSRMDVRTYRKNGTLFSYYYCQAMARKGKQACNSGYIRTDLVEHAFLDQLQQIRLDPAGLKLRRDPGAPARSSGDIKAEIRKTQEAIEHLTDALMQAVGSSASAHIIARIESLDARKRTLEGDLFRSVSQEREQLSREEYEKTTYQNICYLLDHFDEISYTGKNELIRKTIKSCILEQESLRIIL